jgi:hypothetical protein
MNEPQFSQYQCKRGRSAYGQRLPSGGNRPNVCKGSEADVSSPSGNGRTVAFT